MSNKAAFVEHNIGKRDIVEEEEIPKKKVQWG